MSPDIDQDEEDLPYHLTESYDKAGWSGGLRTPDLLCMGCKELICTVGTNLRVKAFRHVAGATVQFHKSTLILTHRCGYVMSLRVADMAVRSSSGVKSKSLKIHNQHLEAVVAKLVAEAEEKQAMYERWEARLQAQKQEVTRVPEVEAENRWLTKELATAKGDAEKLRALAERRYAELSSLREAATK